MGAYCYCSHGLAHHREPADANDPIAGYECDAVDDGIPCKCKMYRYKP